nr:beta-glucuronidase [Prevotella sp.]
MRKYLVLLLLLVSMVVGAQQVIDLSGPWQFSMLPERCALPTAFTETVKLPGSMLTNGKGNDVGLDTPWTGSLYDSSYYFNPYMERYRVEGQMKFPFFLTPDKHYVGRAVYQKTVRVPKSWRRKRVTLFLERAHIETTLLVNGREVGHQMSLSAPHQYDVTDFVRLGKDNTITLIIYNGIENVCVGQDSHSVTDQTQGNWNGVVGKIELRAAPIIWRKTVYPDISKKQVKIVINEQEYLIDMGDDAQLWDEFNPVLYTRNVVYHGDKIPVTFGLREISIKGRQFYLNGRPIWMRGTVENCCFPLTGYPPTDEASWERIFRKCKQYGLNHIRFHSYCPPEAAFVAADRLGLYLQPEGPSWPNHGVKLRRGQSIDTYLLDECKRIVDTYGHHPSFVMMVAGNEPAGDWVGWCNNFVSEMKAYDPSRVYCGASVGGGWAWDGGSQYHVKGGARGLDWDHHAPHSDDDYEAQIDFPRNYKDSVPNNTPIIAHEQGQWCAFPDFREMPLYTGPYKARNFEIFRDLLRDNGMEGEAMHF